VNPCKHVEKFKEQGRERFLTPEELVRIGQAIAEAERSGSEPLAALAALRMLFLTGMRRGEVLSLRWPEVDLERGVLTLPDSKTGAKVVRIGAPAVELLSGLPREAKNPHVFPGRKEGSAFVGLPWVWYRLREKAKLPDVRIHDARHSFASVAASGGSSLLIIGALLGHKRAATTQKYTHLQDDPVRAVADSTSRTIADALAGKVPEPEPAPGKVVSINSPRKRRAKR
jgi:integrase